MNHTEDLVQLLKNLERSIGNIMAFDDTKHKGNVVKGKLKSQKELKKITGSKKYKDSDYEGKTKMLNKATYREGGPVNTKRMNRLEELGRVDAEKAFSKKGKRNLKDEKKRIVRELKKDGGSLKKVKPSQKGLKKLPTKVRNKMGYMKKGGKVGMGKAMRGGGCVR